ncbi:predicted protein [Histoplasma capsulatum G186AR]|uniref:Uncharacterized protein n=1 Tax=Ajellomyces capsulatus (strain G186AR / H82 / ATCC MYA-2454 / RMSCC 2432) TaxID=447093 RepID=C0NI76_AJECG|nr:uncharacterized protein HCBG_03048 [Histoplasma capsulatum G186AR]EEH09511.1 predicted protein [Histoplasma capsulatum G186AR]
MAKYRGKHQRIVLQESWQIASQKSSMWDFHKPGSSRGQRGAKNPGSWLASVPLDLVRAVAFRTAFPASARASPTLRCSSRGNGKRGKVESPPALRENLHNASQDDFDYLLDPPSVSLVLYHIFIFTRAVSYLSYCMFGVNELYIILNSVICFMILSEDHQFPNLRHDLLQLVSVPCVHVAAAEGNPP